jgi:hypothetical protein
MAALTALLSLAPSVGLAQQDVVPPPGASPVYQPTVAAPVQTAVYTPAELDQMLAPIALYPDALLTQILMASTYPTQIVEADRWVSAPVNAGFRGDTLVAVLQPLPWDPSVKSLVPFPQIVRQMNDNLDWTQSLGTAFAEQQSDVMQQVQVLRAQAEAAGTLVTTPQLRVVHDGPAVVIEPANPALVFVPVYNPVVVYGSWAFADYPPVYFAPAPGFFVGTVGVGIGFSVGFGVVGPLWGWGHPAWGGGTVVINNTYYSRISYNHVAFEGSAWHHAGAIARVPGAGFHAPGAGGFRGPAGGFHGGPAGGFHGPAGGFHGPAGPAGFHAPAPHGFAGNPAGRGPASRPAAAPHSFSPAGRGPAPAAHGPSNFGRPGGGAPAPRAAVGRPAAPAPHAAAAPRPAAPARSAPASHGGPPPKKH